MSQESPVLAYLLYEFQMNGEFEFLIDGPANGEHELLLAHGAGAAMDSPFMNYVAEGLAERGIRVVRFEFPYMAERRRTGLKKPPGSPKRLLETWRNAIQARGGPELVIGGKSMGGRLASMIADDLGVRGLVCLGYPFHPPGRPEKLRTDHLQGLGTPALIVQGERDALGNRTEVAGYVLAEQIRVVWLPDGDHSFQPRKKSGRTERDNFEAAIGEVGAFIEAL